MILRCFRGAKESEEYCNAERQALGLLPPSRSSVVDECTEEEGLPTRTACRQVGESDIRSEKWRRGCAK